MPAGQSMISQIVSVMGTPVVQNGVVYAVTCNGNVAAVNAKDGHLIWQHPMSSYVGLAVANGKVFVVDAKSHLYALNQKTGQVIWTNTKFQARSLTAPSVVDGYLVVGDYAGYLQFINTDNGAIVARLQVNSSGINSQPIIFDGHVFATTNDGQLTAVSPFSK